MGASGVFPMSMSFEGGLPFSVSPIHDQLFWNYSRTMIRDYEVNPQCVIGRKAEGAIIAAELQNSLPSVGNRWMQEGAPAKKKQPYESSEISNTPFPYGRLSASLIDAVGPGSYNRDLRIVRQECHLFLDSTRKANIVLIQPDNKLASSFC
jgi:hypothetical protein